MNNTSKIILNTLSFLILLTSCNVSNPETILGIKLGLPEKSQITDLLQAGKLKSESNREYVEYGNFRGYLSAFSIPNSNDIEIINTVSLIFVNPTFRHPRLLTNEFISEFNLQYLIESYVGKYGTPILENHGGYEHRAWKKGDLLIKLVTHVWGQYENTIYCNASVTYSYDEEVIKKLKEDEKKNTKSI